MSNLEIALLTVTAILAFIFLVVGLIWLVVHIIQKKENKLLIQFNGIENSQIVKREKYINTITTKNKQLKSIADFLKQSIQSLESNIKITKKNLFLLRQTKTYSDFKNYKKQFISINQDIQKLQNAISEIDKYALDSKAFKEDSLKLLISIKQKYVEIDNFYVNNLLPENFYNEDLFRLIKSIRKYLQKINALISDVNKEELVKNFSQVISNLSVYAKWNLKAYENLKKMKKIAKVFPEAWKTKNQLVLHFSANELKLINQCDQFINKNYEKTLENIKRGRFNNSEKKVNTMLRAAFFYAAKVNLNKQETAILNQPILLDEIINKTDFMLKSIIKWAGAIIQNWQSEVEKSAQEIFTQNKELNEKILCLNSANKQLSQAKEDMTNKTNHEILEINLSIAQYLKETSLSLGTLNENIFKSNKNFQEIVQKQWTLKIFMIQINDYAKKLLPENNEIYLEIQKSANKCSKLVDKILTGYDVAIKTQDEANALSENLELYKKVITNALGYRLLAIKLYKYWFVLAKRHDKFNSAFSRMILENLNAKKWEDVIFACQGRIVKISNELTRKNSNSQNKFFKFFGINKQKTATTSTSELN
ncbi:hypothetical protein J2Z62_000181 [Mycoplasmoides fastidiosum]|uniref:Septation ring formation regulator n=1 Tax=Mycoplasmoides fastidiosum TaxID=92758 RepID=A0ABU0LYG8_9BACT|nr:hypothetical protein [Mycoplasmoides fastidiosum]MDQ0513743.1 hypothetical protein [Mycoplasmoides fastidiosum]UUD37836.1 hypothetical protein NPA10_00355 [Mycoplasmoides fastidiosum]